LAAGSSKSKATSNKKVPVRYISSPTVLLYLKPSGQPHTSPLPFLPYLGVSSRRYAVLRPQQFGPMRISGKTEGHKNLFDAIADLTRVPGLTLLFFCLPP